MLALSLAAAAFSVRGSAPVVRRSMATTATVSGLSMSAYDYNAKDLRSGKNVELKEFEGKVSLIVNVASK